jgi:HSP20 family protein
VYTPPVDIIERPDGLVMLLDMPGVESKDIDIQYENGLLTVHGKVQSREPENASWLVHEYGTGDYHRSFTVGEGIDTGKIEAELKDGVMRLSLPKAESLKPRKIEVK